VHNLKTLSITSSKLKTFTGSVGRLDKLEKLDLSGNKLSSLPITLAFCKNLRTLDLHNNDFKQLPGVIHKLSNLTTLRRLQNPLTPRHECHGPHYTRKLCVNGDTADSKKVYQPISLQAACTTVIYSSKVEYWGTDVIGPLQCKTLDRLAAQFTICDNCDRMLLPDQGEQS
jgi:Leucine-rich repeat (LRR) protein